MYGYVRPLKGELKVKEFERFKAAYCGLCHTLKKRYGLIGSFVLNYDFTFLFMLLFPAGEAPQFDYARCIASPCKKKCFCRPNASSELCADCSVILAYYKLKDSVADEPFPKSLLYRLSLWALRSAHRRAALKRPNFERSVSENLSALNALEAENNPSMDRAADRFAALLKDVSLERDNDPALSQLLYQLGRWIYLIDAFDDLEDDAKSGSYNPLIARFGLDGDKLRAGDREYFLTTLAHSLNLLSSAFELMPENAWSPILANIIYLGTQNMNAMVLSGEAKNKLGTETYR